MTKDELIEELRYSLPSINILNKVRNGVVEINGEYLFLKKRDELDYIKWDMNLQKNKWVDYGWQYNYDELMNKNVIFGLSFFDGSTRGRKAIEDYLKNSE